MKTDQSLKDIFDTVLGNQKRTDPSAAPPSIYVQGDGNVILFGGTVKWAPPQKAAKDAAPCD